MLSPLQLAVWVMETENQAALVLNLLTATAGSMQWVLSGCSQLCCWLLLLERCIMSDARETYHV